MDRLRNVAVVLAGGTGTRVGLNIPKQLIKIAGKPIIEHTIATMQASPLIDEILVLMAPGYLDEIRAIVRQGGYDKVTQILAVMVEPLDADFGGLAMPTCSIGVACYPADGRDADALLSHADGEMYRVKRRRSQAG